MGTTVINKPPVVFKRNQYGLLEDKNINYEFNALSAISKLKPARFNFISDKDVTLDGFLAHEVSDVVPIAITGKKDGKEMQSIDHSKLVPLLTKGIQEQQSTIEDLKSRIETLEG